MSLVRVTTGSSGARVHLVREGTDPLESRCGRAYAEPDPPTMEYAGWVTLPNACASCARVATVSQNDALQRPSENSE